MVLVRCPRLVYFASRFARHSLLLNRRRVRVEDKFAARLPDAPHSACTVDQVAVSALRHAVLDAPAKAGPAARTLVLEIR